MTYSRSPAPLDLVLRPSRLLRVYLMAFAALAALVPWYLPIPGWASLSLTVCALSWIAVCWRRFIAMSDTASVRALHFRDGDWQLQTVRGRELVRCHGASVWPALVALDMRAGRRRYPVLVLSDSVDADSLRRLRVLLNLGAA